MNMKTKIATFIMAAMMAVPGYALAGSNFDVTTGAQGSGIDSNIQFIPAGVAGGFGGASGAANAAGSGFIISGDTAGNVAVVAGGITDTNTYPVNTSNDVSIGVGSSTSSQAITGSHVDVAVDGFAGGAGAFSDGNASQFTVNGSAVADSPVYFTSDGQSAGVAGQSSAGGFNTNAGAVTLIGDADADATVNIDMRGSSYSNSYRGVDFGTNRVETMGTNVGTATTITTSAATNDDASGLAASGSNVNGGAGAQGGVAALTTQTNNDGTATAATNGSYSGGTNIGGNYAGSAAGYTNTSVQTVGGMNGSVMNSASGMTVHSAQY